MTRDELTGCAIVEADDGDSPIGILKYVDDATENVLFCVETPDGSELLLPAADEFILAIDAENRKIRASLPEGLLDLG